MSDNDGDDNAGNDQEGLSALDSLLCYVERELAYLRTPCENAADAVASARAAIRAHLVSAKAEPSPGSNDDPELLLN